MPLYTLLPWYIKQDTQEGLPKDQQHSKLY